MLQRLKKVYSEEPLRSIGFLSILTVIRAWIQITLFRNEFISVAADEFARGIRAAVWALQPRLDLTSDVLGTWLPLEKYLNGLTLLIWPDVILAPRLTVFIASCLLLIAIYLLAHYLFDSFVIAALSSLLITFLPWYTWLSGTPMLEMYYLCCFFAGLLFLIVWLREGRKGYWLLAGISFMLATGFHVQSWTLVNLVNILTLPYLYKFIKAKQYARSVQLVGCYVISNALIIAFSLFEWSLTGGLFAFLDAHTSYSRFAFDGYNVSTTNKLLYYPRLVAKNSNAFVWVLLILALAFIKRNDERYLKLFPLLLAAASLLFSSIFNLFSGPPSAAPDRYSLFYLLVLSIYMAYGACNLFAWGWRHHNSLVKYASLIIITGLMTYSLWWRASRIPDYPQGMSSDSVEIGQDLNRRLSQNPGAYMIELRYWDFLAVRLSAGHFNRSIYDREENMRERNLPSLFLEDPDEICRSLSSQGVQFVVLIDEDFKSRVQSMAFLSPISEIGRWSLYEFDLHNDPVKISCDPSGAT